MVLKKAAAPEREKEKAREKKESRIVRYFREVRAEIRKVVWPSRRNTINLTLIVLGVTAFMSAALGLLDWAFTQLFVLILG